MIRFLTFLNVDFNLDPFSYVNGVEISQDVNVKNIGISLYHLFELIGIIGIALTIMLCAIKLYIKNNKQQRAETKDSIIRIGLIAILIFGFLGFVGLVLDLVTEFVK